ncbi:MAG: hypothetical protein R3F62_31190 [Planctomycetota bacterium]
MPPAVTALDPEPDFAHPDGQVDWKRAGLTCGLMLLILLGPLAAAVRLFFSRPEAPGDPASRARRRLRS